MSVCLWLSNPYISILYSEYYECIIQYNNIIVHTLCFFSLLFYCTPVDYIDTVRLYTALFGRSSFYLAFVFWNHFDTAHTIANTRTRYGHVYEGASQENKVTALRTLAQWRFLERATLYKTCAARTNGIKKSLLCVKHGVWEIANGVPKKVTNAPDGCSNPSE